MDALLTKQKKCCSFAQEIMKISHQTVLGENGKPAAAIIPWRVFQELQVVVDDRLPSREELEAMLEAEKDRRTGNKEAFVSLSELEQELCL